MLLSESKAVSALKPWWDFAYIYSVIALILVEILYLITSIPSLFVSSHSSSSDDDDKINSTTTPVDNFDHESIFPMYMLIVFVCLILMDFAYTRMFYNAHLIQTLCHIMETISDMRQYRSLGHGLIFANTFHHASNRKSLSILFKIYNAVRVLISIFLLLVLIYSQFHVVIVEHDKSQGHKMLEVTSIIILLFQLGVLSYAILWSFLITKKSLWGQLMNVYKRTLDKIDIARGRCVPSPPNQRRAERILDALNPYVSSENIQLVLDLLAYRAGVGVALRTLAHLEIDVQNNWRPFRLGSKVLSNGALEVNWKDPLAVVYLPPSFPSKLRLHYGIEITFTNEHTDMERIVEIIGYDETRYYQQVWNSSRPNSVSDLRSSDSMQYVEVFRGIPSGAHVEIAVWTIVDGMLISRSTKSREQCIPANRVPKPPRTLEGSPSLPKESPTPSDKMESSSSQPEQMNPNQKNDVKSSLCNSCSSSSTSSSDSTCSQDSENCEEDEDDEGTIQEIPHQRFSTSLVSTDSESSILSLDSSHPSETSSTKPLSTLPAKTKSLTNLILQHENETVMRKVRSSESTTNPSSVLPSNIQNKRLFSEFKNNKNTNNFARNTDKRKSLQIGSGYMNYAFENEAEQK
ncbi:unnamed protein product [Lepeophtheirus salmonis]|uniref:(salmon louse) hypothetical protein n=1 Tax=Lepeophtheirus salmonis TaxID=72036 RepID=A0A7R8CFW9_LEPSM|nr:unnamed protein product [Lepeophtheirus salmonis]CAF2805098.1 unnamed protein product [Lepeophtheirus salmonis]